MSRKLSLLLVVLLVAAFLPQNLSLQTPKASATEAGMLLCTGICDSMTESLITSTLSTMTSTMTMMSNLVSMMSIASQKLSMMTAMADNLRKCCQTATPMDSMQRVSEELSSASSELSESQYDMLLAYSTLNNYASSEMETMLETVSERVNMGETTLMMADSAIEMADEMTESMDRMLESMMLSSSGETMLGLQSLDNELEAFDSLLHSLDQMLEATLSMVSSIEETMKVTF